MSRPQSKEELRAARLRALQAKMPNAAAAIEASTHEQSTPSQHHDIPVSTTQTSPTTTTTTKVTPILNATLFQALLKLVYVGGEATDEDLLRWTNEGFRFCPEPNFGLRQGHGGPCGILAVTQAEMVKELFFTEQGAAKYLSLPELSNVEVEIALVRAMSNILLRARPNSNDDVHVLAVTDDTNVNKVLRHWNIGAMELHSYSSKEDLFTALHSMLQQFRGQSGCILFLLSLVLTRGVEQIRQEMDDSTSPLIGQFGHCNQELINLLLSGQATTNVFDGNKVLGDAGMTIHGVGHRCEIGYLTQLEALRYCEVGNYLKVPVYPVWVVGSSSHFTILFSLQTSVNEESTGEKMLSTLRRCFKAIDKDECGFIPSSCLKEVLDLINQHHEYDNNPILRISQSDMDIARLRGHLQVDGEIILWSNFWVNISKLMSGESLDNIINYVESDSNVMAVYSPRDNVNQGSSSSAQPRPRSDSEIARQLQDELDSDPNFDFSSLTTGGFETPNKNKHSVADSYDNSNTWPEEQQKRPRSDSEIARELQEQFNSESDFYDIGNDRNQMNNVDMETSSTVATGSSSPVHMVQAMHYPTQNVATASEDRSTLYHFNGLQSFSKAGALTKLIMMKRTSNNVIGELVPLGHDGNSTYGYPIEEVMRTRWSGCTISWPDSASPPQID